MATLNAQRIREPAEASGAIGIRAAARKYARYGATDTTLRHWVSRGEVLVARPAASPGDTVLLDEASLRRRIAVHSPHRDNQKRRTRVRTIPEMQRETERLAGPHSAGGTNGHHQPAAASLRRGVDGPQREVLLGTRAWVDRFITFQTQKNQGVINPRTKHNYD